MAREKSPHPILSVKQAIVNNLCVAYRRSQSNGLVAADEVRRKLAITNDLFNEALNSFLLLEKQMAVEVIEIKGRTYLRLSQSVTELCADWELTQKRGFASKPAHPVAAPHEHTIPRPIMR